MEVVHLEVVGDEDVAVAGTLQHSFQAVGSHSVVRIQQGNPFALRSGDADVARCSRSAIDLATMQPDARVAPGPLLYQLSRPIGGGIVDHKDFDVGEGLGLGRIERLQDRRLAVVHGQQDGDAGHQAGSGANFCRLSASSAMRV